MSPNDERPPDDQPRESEPRDAEGAAAPEGEPEAPEGSRDILERIIDNRVAAFFTETWPVTLQAVITGVVDKIDLEAIAARAHELGVEQSTEIIKRRLARAPAGAGGSDGRASDGGGGDGGGDDGADDVRALGDLPEGPGRTEVSAVPRPVSTGDRRDQMVTGLLMGLSRIFEDPAKFLTATIDAYVKLKQAGKGPPDDLALAQGLRERNPWLFDVFGKPDPLEERIPTIMARALDLGMKVGSKASPSEKDAAQALRDLVRGERKDRRVKPSEDRPVPGRPVDLSAAPAADDTAAADRAAPEPAIASAAQDPQPTRGTLRKVV